MSRFRSFFESFQVEPSILGITIRSAVKFYTDMVVFDFFRSSAQKHVKTLDTVLGSFFKGLVQTFPKKIISKKKKKFSETLDPSHLIGTLLKFTNQPVVYLGKIGNDHRVSPKSVQFAKSLILTVFSIFERL